MSYVDIFHLKKILILTNVIILAISRCDTLRPLGIYTKYSEGAINSSHTHNLAKSQSYRVLKLLLSDIRFMTTVNPTLIYHRFQENWCMLVISARHMLVIK